MKPFMTARPRLEDPAAFTSAARAELALAIAARDGHAAAADTLSGAWPTLNAEADRAWTAQQTARASVEAAKGLAAEQAVAAAIAGTAAPAGSMGAARAALTAAEDAYEVAKGALEALPARQTAAGEQAQELSKRVDRAASKVLGEHAFARALAGRVDAMQREMVVLADVLSWMRGAGVIQTATHEICGPNLPDYEKLVNQAVGRLHNRPSLWFTTEKANELLTARVGAGIWEAALEVLKRDPQAPLPIVELP